MRFVNIHKTKILVVVAIFLYLLAQFFSIPFWNITHESIKTESHDLQVVYGNFVVIYYLLIFTAGFLFSTGLIIFIIGELFKIKSAKKVFPEFKKRIFFVLIACGIFFIIFSFMYVAPFMHADLYPSFQDLLTGYYSLLFIGGICFFLGAVLFVISLFGICFKFMAQKFEIKLRITKRK